MLKKNSPPDLTPSDHPDSRNSCIEQTASRSSRHAYVRQVHGTGRTAALQSNGGEDENHSAESKGGSRENDRLDQSGVWLGTGGQKTLLIDLDPQAHSSAIYCPASNKDATIGAMFEDRNLDISRLIQPAEVHGEPADNLFIIPSNIHLAVTAERVISLHFRERMLDRALRKLQGNFEMILLDCPPNLGVITANAIYTADHILIPTTYGRYSLDGIADLFASIDELREDRPGGRFILRNAFDSRNKQTNDYIDRELEKVRDLLLQTILRKTEAINQAQINGEPIFTFDSGGHGAQDFEALTREVLTHG